MAVVSGYHSGSCFCFFFVRWSDVLGIFKRVNLGSRFPDFPFAKQFLVAVILAKADVGLTMLVRFTAWQFVKLVQAVAVSVAVGLVFVAVPSFASILSIADCASLGSQPSPFGQWGAACVFSGEDSAVLFLCTDANAGCGRDGTSERDVVISLEGQGHSSTAPSPAIDVSNSVQFVCIVSSSLTVSRGGVVSWSMQDVSGFWPDAPAFGLLKPPRSWSKAILLWS